MGNSHTMWISPKNKAYVPLLAVLLLGQGCSFLGRRMGEKDKAPSGRSKYLLTDKSGKFLVFREVGAIQDGNKLVVKRQVFNEGGDTTKPLERSISISRRAKLGDIEIMRPEAAQYNVWFDGKKYFSQMRISAKGKLEIRTKGPSKEDSKVQNFTLPKGTGVYCFFSQMLECVRATGFVAKAQEKGGGKMNFHVLWDGHPFLQEQYNSLGDQPYSQATFEFDGKSEHGDERYTLQADGQSIFFFLSKRNKLAKIFWVSEGLSMAEAGGFGEDENEGAPERLRSARTSDETPDMMSEEEMEE